MHATVTIAAYTLLEALRNRLLWLLGASALAAIGLSGFLQELALTEGRQIQLALLAALLRFAAVFLIATFVVTSMVREANDKGMELLLALPVPRAAYLFGKLGGFAALACLPALLFGALCLCFAPFGQTALWSVSLLWELWIVAAFSLLCVLGLGQVLPALAAVAGFYLLARSVGSLQLMAHGPLGRHGAAQQALQAGIDGIAALLPRLDLFTRSEWLLYHTGNAQVLFELFLHSAACLALLASAALFDLYRKSI